MWKPSAAGVESSGPGIEDLADLAAAGKTPGIVADGADRLWSWRMSEPQLIEKTGVEDSPARTRAPGRAPFRIGAVQEAWHPDPASTARPWRPGSASPRRAGRPPRLPAGADALALLRRRPGRAGGGRGRAGGAARGPDLRVRRGDGARDRRPRPCLALRARAGGWSRLQHGDRRRPRRRPGRPHPQAPHPDHRRLLRGPLLPPRPGRRRAVPAGHPGRGPARPADLLGPVVPGARPRLQLGRRRDPHLPDRDRLRARPPRLRHRSRSGSA